jgi:hypothetical protein
MAMGTAVEPTVRAVGRETIARTVLAVAAAALVVLAARLPVWEARLDVLQYPGRPLVLTAYGDRLEGDVDEVKILNHYVGLHVFDMAELDETALWIPAIAAGLVCVAIAWAIPRRSPGGSKPSRSWLGTLARLGLWLIPLGIIVDIQYRLYELGHSMDPGAAFRQPPFTPPVIGKAAVASNVTTTAWPGRAVMFLFVAAFLMTFGMSLYRFGRQLLGMETAAGEAEG